MNLREKRRERGMTQTELAKAVGSGQSSIARFEKGQLTPKPHTAQKIAAVLGFSWTEFYEEVDSDRGKVSGDAAETAERMAPGANAANACRYDAPGV